MLQKPRIKKNTGLKNNLPERYGKNKKTCRDAAQKCKRLLRNEWRKEAMWRCQNQEHTSVCFIRLRQQSKESSLYLEKVQIWAEHKTTTKQVVSSNPVRVRTRMYSTCEPAHFACVQVCVCLCMCSCVCVCVLPKQIQSLLVMCPQSTPIDTG